MHPKLTKAFYRKNQLQNPTAALFIVTAIGMNQKDQPFDRMMKKAFAEMASPEQKAAQAAELQEIEAMETPEQIVDIMRKSQENVNVGAICEKALSMEDAVMPLVIQRYYRSRVDRFLECAATLLFWAKEEYILTLYENWKKIVDPYALALLCLVMGMRNMQGDEIDAFLVEQYERLKTCKSEIICSDFPLFALQMKYCYRAKAKKERSLEECIANVKYRFQAR